MSDELPPSIEFFNECMNQVARDRRDGSRQSQTHQSPVLAGSCVRCGSSRLSCEHGSRVDWLTSLAGFNTDLSLVAR